MRLFFCWFSLAMLMVIGCQRSLFLLEAKNTPCYVVTGLTTYDLRTKKTYTFAKNIQDIIGEKTFNEFWQKCYTSEYRGFEYFSCTGRYIAARSITEDTKPDNQKLLILDTINRKAVYFSLSDHNLKMYMGVWDPSESKFLLELAGKEDGSFQLGLMERDGNSEWQARILPINFGKETDVPISFYPWISEDRFMYENSGKLFEYDLKTGMSRFVRDGYCGISIKDGVYVYCENRCPIYYHEHPEEKKLPRDNVLVRNGKEINLKWFISPIVSPDGKFILYDDNVPGLYLDERVYFIYDVQKTAYYRILGWLDPQPDDFGLITRWLKLTPETQSFYWPNKK